MRIYKAANFRFGPWQTNVVMAGMEMYNLAKKGELI